MHEFEAKFTGIDKKKVIEKLHKLGFEQIHPEVLMVRKSLHPKEHSKKWARVRKEADKITATVKEVVKDNALDGVLEAEVVVNDFDNAVHLFEMCGFHVVAYQETKREKWQRDDVEIMFDIWPGLQCFIEIEAPNEGDVVSVSNELGLDMREALFGGVDVVYEKELGLQPDIINKMPEITFKNPPKAS